MNMLTVCPNCHHTDLHCHALIRATLHSFKDNSGTVQLSLLDWDQIESVESYECLNCGYRFVGKENFNFFQKK